jgi:hypothetical protein
MRIIVTMVIFQILNLEILHGIYVIKYITNNLYFALERNNLILSKTQSNFRLISIKQNLYFIEIMNTRKKLGVNNNNKIKIYDNKEKINENKKIWNITRVRENEYVIYNLYNFKIIEIINNSIKCSRNITDIFNNNSNKNLNTNFNFIKLVEEAKIIKKFINIINNEEIDVVIKYIDLTDITLKREGITQIYKDKDNEELRYCIRSILQNIPWIRNIIILMPNEKVKFLKSITEIRNKIIYVKDKDFLGFDSANIHSFTFQLFKLENFGISKNFIYMEDDFFIGKPLKKTDFFYYDIEKKQVLPLLLTKYFQEINKKDILEQCNQYYSLFKNIENIHPHSYEGWWLSIYNTDLYFLERYNNTIINTNFTHNAISENIDELKTIFKEIQNYKFINETLLSKERHILTLNQPHFLNLYQLNINHKKTHPLHYQYIPIEKIKTNKLNSPLFVLNTGGNHIPSNRQYKIQKKIMEKRFPFPTEYEIVDNKQSIIQGYLIKFFFLFFFSFFIVTIVKIFILYKEYI